MLVAKKLRVVNGNLLARLASTTTTHTSEPVSTPTEDAADAAEEEAPKKQMPHYKQLDAKTRAVYERIIRVDHAGEFGADRIYAGQLSVLGKTEVGPLIQHMWDQEKAHLAKFEELIGEYRVRPTVLHPFWKVAGYALGAGSAMLGKEAAMACTVAVEESITQHYNDQLRELLKLTEESGDKEKHAELMKTIAKFRDEEMEHHDHGIDNDAEQAPGFQLMKGTIQAGCKVAIFLSERI